MQNVVQHGTSLEIVQQDVILKCGDLDQHDIGTCEAKAKSTTTIKTNATRRCDSGQIHIFLCGY
jgi:hypothetical protein